MEVVITKADIRTPLKPKPIGIFGKIKKAVGFDSIPKFRDLDVTTKAFTVCVIITILFGMSVLIVNVLMFSK